jgi:hypothetical protein
MYSVQNILLYTLHAFQPQQYVTVTISVPSFATDTPAAKRNDGFDSNELRRRFSSSTKCDCSAGFPFIVLSDRTYRMSFGARARHNVELKTSTMALGASDGMIDYSGLM